MPLHDYTCACGHTDTLYHRGSAPEFEVCPQCGKAELKKQISLPHNHVDYSVPIEQYSIAMNTPEEIRKFKARAPDVEVEDRDRDHPLYGVPVARNRHQKLQALKAAGFQEIN